MRQWCTRLKLLRASGGLGPRIYVDNVETIKLLAGYPASLGVPIIH